MKKLTGSLLVYLISFLSYATETTSSKINSVTVFTENAQINRTASVNLKKGENTIRFTNLELNANPNSIQLYGNQNNKYITIVSTMFLEEVIKPKNEKRILRITDSIKEIDRDIKLLSRQIDNFNQEKKLIIAHTKVEYGKTSDYIDLVNSLLKYYRESTLELDRMIVNTDILRKEKTTTLNELNNRLDRLNSEAHSGTIEAKIFATKPTVQNLKLSYIVPGVSWTPFYDIKSDGINHPLKVSCKATIQQNTGIDWTNVSLILSTRKPSNLGKMPTIHPWYLHFQSSYKNYRNNHVLIPQHAHSNASLPLNQSLSNNKIALTPTDYLEKFKNATHKMLNREYKSHLKHNVSGKNGIAVIELDNFDMKAQYRYYTIPKYDPNVYLMAQIKSYEQYDLIPAFANIFLEGVYVGKLFVNPEIAMPSLELMLGKDSDIIVDRRKIAQSSSKQRKLTGNNLTTSIEIEVTVKNRKGTQIDLIMKDQVPISKHEDILVEVLKTSKAQLDTTSGTLTWKQSIQPQKPASYTIKYEVTRPKNKKIANF